MQSITDLALGQLIHDYSNLPNGMGWYYIEDPNRIIFPIIIEGRPTGRAIMYLVYKTADDYFFKYGIEFVYDDENLDSLLIKVHDAVINFQQKLIEEKAILVNSDGGDLGRGDNLSIYDKIRSWIRQLIG